MDYVVSLKYEDYLRYSTRLGNHLIILAAFGSVCRILLPSSFFFLLPAKSLQFLAVSGFSNHQHTSPDSQVFPIQAGSGSLIKYVMCLSIIAALERTSYGVQCSQLIAMISQLSSQCDTIAANPSRSKRPFYRLSNASSRQRSIAMLSFGCLRISCKLL